MTSQILGQALPAAAFRVMTYWLLLPRREQDGADSLYIYTTNMHIYIYVRM